VILNCYFCFPFPTLFLTFPSHFHHSEASYKYSIYFLKKKTSKLCFQVPRKSNTKNEKEKKTKDRAHKVQLNIIAWPPFLQPRPSSKVHTASGSGKKNKVAQKLLPFLKKRRSKVECY